MGSSRIWDRKYDAQMDGRAGLFFARARFTAGSEIGISPLRLGLIEHRTEHVLSWLAFWNYGILTIYS